jgi:hypothetical protein
MEGLLFLAAIIAVAIVIFRAIAETRRPKEAIAAKANSAGAGSLQNPLAERGRGKHFAGRKR